MRHTNASGLAQTSPCGSPPTEDHRLRLRLVLWFFLLGFFTVSVHLIALQINPEEQLTAEEDAHEGTKTLRIPRGDILDRNGSLLATDRLRGSLWADPNLIEDPNSAALLLSAGLDLSEETIFERLTSRREEGSLKEFVWVKRWLSDEEMARVEQLQKRIGPGISLRSEPVRFYPEGELAAHMLGFANRIGHGCEGVEGMFDKYLACVPGEQRFRVDARRNVLESLTLEYIEPEGGDTVILTLDKALQHALERELDAAMVRVEAPRAMGLIIDPRTGALLALACRPAFDPNRYSEYPPELLKNRALVDVFEPGSSFKIVTASAALERGLITTETMIDCENGSFNPYGHRIHDYHSMGVEPFRRCFAQSSNIAMIKVGAMLGPEPLYEWIRRYGFGDAASKEFTTESRGILRPSSQWTKYSMGALPMGQEVSVTMLQLARAFSVVANGGYLVTPYILERAVSPEGQVTYEHDHSPPPQILSPATAEIMKNLCHLVVTEGTGTTANIAEYRVGGKTGTAQIARPGGGGYLPDKYTAVFAGFAPVADPRYCAVIVIQEPGIRQRWGGYCCGPVFKAVIREALIRENCPEDPVAEPVKEGETVAEEAPAAMTLASATPADQEASAPLDGLELMPLHEAAEGEPVLPSLIGLTKNQARQKLSELGLHGDFYGAGRVVSQDPPQATPLAEVTLCRLEFSSGASETIPSESEGTGANTPL